MFAFIMSLIIAIPVVLIGLLFLYFWIQQISTKEGREELKNLRDEEKYCNYMFTCPMCGSNKVMRIGTMNRAASVAVTGLASSKIGKQYECDNCKHKF